MQVNCLNLPDKRASSLKRLLWKVRDFDWVPYSIKKIYYGIVPYDYRPHNIYYFLKCSLWKKYNRIHIKSLPPTWSDRSTLLPFAMFQILSDFIEKECGPDGHVDWEGSGHTVSVQGTHVNVRKEFDSLNRWWKEKYLDHYEKIREDLWDKIFALEKKNEDIPLLDKNGKVYAYEWKTTYKDKETEEYNRFLVNMAADMEQRIEEELIYMMGRLCKVHSFMWT